MSPATHEKLYLVGTHRMSLHPGEPAEITRVVMATPEDGEPLPAFKIRFPDGTEDFVPIFAAPGSNEKNPHYEFVVWKDITNGNIQKIIH